VYKTFLVHIGVFSFAKNYQAINYVRLDPSGIAKDVLLQSIKDNIAKGFPCMFGFTVYNSIQQSASTEKIPYPCEGEKNRRGRRSDGCGL
jgi:hypothetical protein